MKITEERIRRITVSEVQGLDPIRVMLEDIGPGQGRINIECWGQSWASYWGHMGKLTIAQFFCSCNEGYLAGNLAPNLPDAIFDPQHLSDHLKSKVIKKRRKHRLTHEEAREQFDEIEYTCFPETIDGLWAMSDTMETLLGDEWWYRLPEKPNPDYQYLTRIIKTVQAALLQLETA